MRSPATRIDVHHHLVPERYAQLLRDKGIQPGGVDVPSWTPDASRKVMRANSIASAVLSVSTPGAWFGDVAESHYWARWLNEYCAGLVEADPRRFGFFATLTLPDVDGAIAEAEHALDNLKADGIVLLANTDGRYLGDAAFDRLLAFLNERRAVVFVHPGDLPAPPADGVPPFTADFLLDTTRTAISLIASGALEKYPHIKWILAHAGGFVPYVAHRILLTMLRNEPKWKLAALALNQERAVEQRMQMFKRFWFDIALSSTPATFPSLLAVADPAKLLYGSDFPFAPGMAVKYMRNQYELSDLPDGLRTDIDHRNAEVLFPRLTRTPS